MEMFEIFNTKDIESLSKAIVKYYQMYKIKPLILIGQDEFDKNDYVCSVLQTMFLKYGIDVHILGVCSMPCLTFVKEKYNYPFALYINSYNIQIANTNLKNVNKIYDDLSALKNRHYKLKSQKFASVLNVEKIKHDYLSFLKSITKFDVDCFVNFYHSGVFASTKTLFSKQVKVISKFQDVNLLKAYCIKHQKIGISFNSSGSSVTIVDENGNVLTSEQIVFVLSKFFLKSGDTICFDGENSLNDILKKHNICVSNKFLDKAKIFATKDGKIKLVNFSNCFDGVLIYIIISNLIGLSNMKLSELLLDFC